MGQDASEWTILQTFRLQQLCYIAKAWDLPVDLNLTKKPLVRILRGYEDGGVFNRPPKYLYEFERAKFTPDNYKEARANGGFTGTPQKPGRFCTAFAPWTGPDPDAYAKDHGAPVPQKLPKDVADQKNLNEWQAIRKKARDLGIPWGGRKKDALLKEIAIREMANQPGIHFQEVESA